MQINNLTERDVKEIEGKIFELMKNNPSIDYNIFHLAPKKIKNKSEDLEYTDIMQRLSEIEARIVGLENVIKLIFGRYVLMNGRFVEIK